MESPCYNPFYVVPMQCRVVSPAFCSADALLDRGSELQGTHFRLKSVCKVQEGAALDNIKVAAVNHNLSSSMKSIHQRFFTSSPAPECVLPDEELAQYCARQPQY